MKRPSKVIARNINIPIMPVTMFIKTEVMSDLRKEAHFIPQRIKVSINTTARKTTIEPKINVVDRK